MTDSFTRNRRLTRHGPRVRDRTHTHIYTHTLTQKKQAGARTERAAAAPHSCRRCPHEMHITRFLSLTNCRARHSHEKTAMSLELFRMIHKRFVLVSRLATSNSTTCRRARARLDLRRGGHCRATVPKGNGRGRTRNLKTASHFSPKVVLQFVWAQR